MKKLGLFIGLLMISTLAYADDNGANALGKLGNFFSLSSYDYSYHMLIRVFGQVGGVLPGQIGLLGTMFYTFNQVVLALGIIVVIYTVVMSIIHTAHEGEFLGKNYNSIWVPIRTVLGIVLLIPTASGYSLIQIFMMWLVLQGVGAADSVWQSALNYLQNNNSIITQAGQQFTSGNDAITQAQNVLQSAICMQREYYNANGSPSDPLQTPTLTTNSSTAQYNFTYDGDYGVISWALPNGGDSNTQNLNQNIQTGIQEMVSTLNNTARQYVYNGANSVTGVNPIEVTSDNLESLVQDAQQSVASNQTNLTNTFWQQAYQYGWADAGAYYHSIAMLNQKAAQTYSLAGVSYSPQSCTLDQADQNFVNGLVSNVWNQDSFSSSGSAFNAGPNSPIYAGASSQLSTIGTAFNNMLNNTQSEDPILYIQSLGNIIVRAVTAIWAIGLALIISQGIVANICNASNPAGAVFNLVTNLIVLPAMGFTGLFYIAGLTMAVYIPLIPYIIFSFGVIGWMIAVLETIIAAPLVALGITHPEGRHEVLGHAEPAMMLMVNVFMRPTLMIFGLLAGMLIADVAVQFINWLYLGVVGNLTAFQGGSLAGELGSGGAGLIGTGVELILYVIIYVSIVIIILNKSFALIHIIPDQVLRWIGGQHTFGEYTRGAEEEAKTNFGGAAQSVKGAQDSSYSGAESGAERIRTAIKAQRDKNKSQNEAQGELNKQRVQLGDSGSPPDESKKNDR